MIDLEKVYAFVRSSINCPSSFCTECKAEFGLKDTEDNCPLRLYKKEAVDFASILSKYLNSNEPIITEEEFMEIMKGKI